MRTRQTEHTQLNDQQRALIAAVNAGKGRLRELMKAAGYSSTSVVKYQLELLAELGHLVLLKTSKGTSVYTGRDYASGWDASARMAGNPDA